MQLPIYEVMAEIKKALSERDELILEAPPGAGKTTAVPLELLKSSWLTGKILLLEPRRMAARAVAHRMAQLLDEEIGQTVGYRIRQETRVSAKTKLEVVTGGVILKLLQEDPSLQHYSLIIFDEFHERGLDSDLALSLCLHGRTLFRDGNSPLKLLLMSATLDGERMAELVNSAPIIRSQGKCFPVDVIHLGESTQKDLIEKITQATFSAHQKHTGSILVFLPGQKEIQRCAQQLRGLLPSTTAIFPLYGAMPLSAQIRAIEPLKPHDEFLRKIVLATDIAETSLTIDGITVVIDSCYRREPTFDPRTGLTRLTTSRISRASVTQRSGRAGRTAPGTAYRLISSSTSLLEHAKAEIVQADLAPLALHILQYGVNHPNELRWIDPPPEQAYRNAITLLEQMQAVDISHAATRITAHGEQLTQLGVHPRLAHMMIQALDLGLAEEACFLAAFLSEPGRPKELSNNADDWMVLHSRSTKSLTDLHKTTAQWLQRVLLQKAVFLKQIKPVKSSQRHSDNTIAGQLIALAFPDRIARLRANESHVYLMSNGRAGRLEMTSSLQGCSWLAVAETGGLKSATEDTIYAAAPLTLEHIETLFSKIIRTENAVEWNEQKQRFTAEKRQILGALVLHHRAIENPDPATKQLAIANYIKKSGFSVLNWSDECRQLCQRVCLVNKILDKSLFADCTESTLLAEMDLWLSPYLTDIKTAQDLKKIDLLALLKHYIGWSNLQKLDALAPQAITVPSGHLASINYSHSPPVLEVKLQEMFGCTTTPAIIEGKLPLMLHLLSPAKRPLQITQDLQGFWRGSYKEVQKEMKGRYPKHPWPDDPINATPTKFTKNRAANNP